MSIKTLQIGSIPELIKKASLNEATDYLFILPSLETKKEMVERMAQELKTVPDKRILRLNEFFINLTVESEPLIQFLDKDLLILLLKSSLNSQPYAPFTQVALDYVSIFAPILGRDLYREALEELIESDPTFLKNYGDIYGFMIQIWDQLNASKRILPAWSLGWLYKNFKLLENKHKTVYIIGFNKLKNIEKEFFEELAKSWDIYDTQIINDSAHLADNKNTVVHLTSLADEVAWCLDYLKNKPIDEVTNFIIPKTKWYYKELLESFVQNETEIFETESENIRNKINSFLSPLRVQSDEYKNSDIQNIMSGQKEVFTSYEELRQQTANIFDLNLLKSSLRSVNDLPSEKTMNFFTFLDWALFSKHSDKTDYKEDILRKLYSLALQIPNNLKLSYRDWYSFVNVKLEAVSPSLKSRNFNFYTIEEMPWQTQTHNIFLSCTRMDYERSAFAYLSDFEVDKIKTDLGFDLQGIGLAENFALELQENAKLSMSNYFICPNFDHIGASQQKPKFVESMVSLESTIVENYEVPKNENILTILKNINKCVLPEFKIKHLSASSLQKYISDPYSYFLDKVLGLKDEDPLDLDPSHLMSGSIFHLLLEKGIDNNLGQHELEKIVKDEVTSFYRNWKNTNSQERQISKYVEDFTKYIENDKLEKQTKNRKTLFVEKDFEAYFDLSDLKFYKDYKKGRVGFKGQIDRIDVINNKCFIIDYKSTKNSVNLVRNLKAEPQIQMPLYAMMIQDKIVDLPYPLIGLVYIAIKDNFEVIPSMILPEGAEDLMGEPLHPRHMARVDHLEFNGIIDEYRRYIKSVILDMQNNTFNPLIFEGEERAYFTDF